MPNFVLLSLLLSAVLLLLARVVVARREAAALTSAVPGYTYHPAHTLAIERAALPATVTLEAMETFHSHGRARLVFTATTEEREAGDGAWAEALLEELARRTRAHVIALELRHAGTHQVVGQWLLAEDGRGWTGERLDTVRWAVR